MSVAVSPVHSKAAGAPKSRVLAESRQQIDGQGALSTVVLPASAVFELPGVAMALWSDNRAHGVLNNATTELLAFEKNRCSVRREFWLACIDPRDRERAIKSWEGECGEQMRLLYYRFWPLNGAPAIQLEEAAVRLAVAGDGQFAVLCRYRAIGNERSGTSNGSHPCIGELVHQIGNSLQAVRGEVELLRLFGGLPQRNFENISRGIDCIHELVAQIDGLAESERGTSVEKTSRR